MNPSIQPKKFIALFLISLMLASIPPSQRARAVVPPPDGGYPGGNTAEGQSALLSLSTGGYNTAVGFLSLSVNTNGSFNTAIGAGALLANTANDNTATGAGALLSNTTGSQNTADGTFTLFLNTTGPGNTAVGSSALEANTTGGFNTAVGLHSLISNKTASDNTALGAATLFSNTTGGGNTATGDLALTANSTGDSNTATGFEALSSNTTGVQNTANGHTALLSNTTGINNVADGDEALSSNTIGGSNTAVGAETLFNNTTGTNNVALGFAAGQNVSTAANVICIGIDGENVSNTCYIGNIFNVGLSSGTAVFIQADGQLGTSPSSKRFKEHINPMDKASEALFALKPVTFHYKRDIDEAGIQQFGLVAEDVEKVNPDLVVRDKEGKPYSVRYEQVNAMLLNEFLKEHRHVQEQNQRLHEQAAMIARQQKQIEALTSGLAKVSAKLEVSRLAPQTIVDSQ